MTSLISYENLMNISLHKKLKFFSIKDFFSKRDQIRKNLRIWSRLLKKFLMKNFIFWAAFKLGMCLQVADNILGFCKIFRNTVGRHFRNWIYLKDTTALRTDNITAKCYYSNLRQTTTVLKVSVYGIFLARICPHSDWMYSVIGIPSKY